MVSGVFALIVMWGANPAAAHPMSSAARIPGPASMDAMGSPSSWLTGSLARRASRCPGGVSAERFSLTICHRIEPTTGVMTEALQPLGLLQLRRSFDDHLLRHRDILATQTANDAVYFQRGVLPAGVKVVNDDALLSAGHGLSP